MVVATIVALAACGVLRGTAGEGPSPKPPRAKKEPRKERPVTPEEREQAALEFARRHHPELVKLLAYLKTNEAKEYQRAVSELFRTSERLEHARQRDEKRYELELKAWQLRSQIQLLAAKLKLSPDDKALLSKLSKLLTEQVDLRREMLVAERQRLSERIAQIDEQIAKTAKDREKQVQKQLDVLLRQTSKGGRREDARRDKEAAEEKPAKKPRGEERSSPAPQP